VRSGASTDAHLVCTIREQRLRDAEIAVVGGIWSNNALVKATAAVDASMVSQRTMQSAEALLIRAFIGVGAMLKQHPHLQSTASAHDHQPTLCEEV
jgi:hypothetical protein